MMAHSCGVPAAKFKAVFPDVPYLLTLQEGDPPAHIERKMRPFQPWFNRAFTSADRVQVISNFLGNWAKEKGYQGEPIHIPNAVHTAHFTTECTGSELAAVRQEFGVAADDVLLVTTSRLVHKNAIDDVLRALTKLPAHVKFIVFGTGPDEQLLQDLISEHNLQDRAQLRGQIDHADMPRYLKACDIFIRPSRSEGMGNSFIEAMAADLPVIATQVGGIADFLFDAVRNPATPATGWAVDPDSPDQIAVAVQAILTDRQATNATVTRAKAMVLAQYDWDLIAQRMDQEVFAKL
jgi:glycosyltransferase involved in cell wall biosynthesis